MYQRFFKARFNRAGWIVLLAVIAAGCSGTAVKPSTENKGALRTESAEIGKDHRQQVNPARVEVDAGVGFTVTEAVSISSSVRADYAYALQLLVEDQAEAGIELLLEVTERFPDATTPFVDLGIAYGKSGDNEKAVKAFQAALAATPDHPVAHNELGIAYRRLGRFTEARASYERALAIYPGFHFARRNLAVLCDLYLADLDCALEEYQNYQVVVSDDPQVDMWIADLRNRMGAAQ
jgi:Flp pilus assembly protein TadD